MKPLNWRLAFAALIACVSALALAGCPQQDEPDETPTSDVVPDNDTTDNDDTDNDDATDDTNDQDLPGDEDLPDDMKDEEPMDDPTGNPLDDDATADPTP